jgi:hypothetical protein
VQLLAGLFCEWELYACVSSPAEKESTVYGIVMLQAWGVSGWLEDGWDEDFTVDNVDLAGNGAKAFMEPGNLTKQGNLPFLVRSRPTTWNPAHSIPRAYRLPKICPTCEKEG